MRKFIACVAGGVLASLWLGYLLVPADREISDGLVRDGESLVAKPLLEDRYARGERGPYLLRRLAEIRIATGEVSGAEEVAIEAGRAGYYIKGFEELHLDAVRASLDPARQREALGKATSEPEVLREQAFLAALLSDRHGETQALEQLAARDEASPPELLRLSLLLAAQSQPVEAASVLERLDREADVGAQGGFLRTEFELLSHTSEAFPRLADRARRFLGVAPSTAGMLNVSWALRQAGRSDVAQKILEEYRAIVLEDPTLLSVFISLLRAAGDHGALHVLVQEKFERGLSKEAERELMIETVVSVPVLLPVVAEYVKRDELHLEREELDKLAYAALSDAGDTATAELFLKKAAALGGPNDRALKQLLYLWGPKPDQSAVKWLESRARESERDQRVRWIALLKGVSAVGSALDIIEEWGWEHVPGMSDEAEPLLWAAGTDSSEASRIFDMVALHERSASRVLRFAAIARGAKLYHLATRLAERSLQLSGADRGATLLTLFGIASDTKERERAAVYARELFETPLADDNSLPADQLASAAYQAALLKHREGAVSESKTLFVRALTIARRAPPGQLDAMLVAHIVAEIEGPSEAAGVLEEASHNRPLSGAERALLGRLLAKAGRLEEAKAAVF